MQVRLALLGGLVLGVLAQIAQFPGALDFLRQLGPQLALDARSLRLRVASESAPSCVRLRLQPVGVPPGYAADELNFECSISAILVRTTPSPANRAAVIAISSRQNPFVQQCRALARRRDAADGEVLLDGLHLLSDALAAGVPVSAAAAAQAFWQSPVGARARGLAGVEPAPSSTPRAPRVLEAASPVKSPTGIVAIARWQAVGVAQVLAAQPALVVCADRVQDPGNTGAIIRAAEAAGATGVITTAGSADPFGWKALRGSMGSAFRLPIAAGADAGAVCRQARELRPARRRHGASRGHQPARCRPHRPRPGPRGRRGLGPAGRRSGPRRHAAADSRCARRSNR